MLAIGHRSLLLSSIEPVSISELVGKLLYVSAKPRYCQVIHTSAFSAYITRLKNLSAPLKLLVENEMYRLSVWGNPINDVKRGADYAANAERTMLEVLSLPSRCYVIGFNYFPTESMDCCYSDCLGG